MEVEFAEFTDAERRYVKRIVKRLKEYSSDLDSLEVTMDLAAVHKTTPLRLRALSTADKMNLLHDIYGIRDNLDRDTGRLKEFFFPRFAQKEKKIDREKQ